MRLVIWFVDTIDWDKLSDNRDIPAAQCWQLHDYTPEEQHENYNQEVGDSLLTKSPERR